MDEVARLHDIAVARDVTVGRVNVRGAEGCGEHHLAGFKTQESRPET